MTQAAQTALSDDSLNRESEHAGSVTADNSSSVKGSCMLFQVLSHDWQENTAQGCQSRVTAELQNLYCNNKDYPVLSTSL